MSRGKKDNQDRDPWELHFDRPVILNNRQIEDLNQELQNIIDEVENQLEGEPTQLRTDLLILCRLAEIGRLYLESRGIKSLIIDADELVSRGSGK